MKEKPRNYIDNLENEFKNSFISIDEYKDEVTLSIKKDDAFNILKAIKESDDTLFDYLVDVTVVDYLKLGGLERYAVVYHLYSNTYNSRFRVKVWVPETDMVVETVYPLWKSCIWFERECHEMYGMKFHGHPDMSNLLIPDNFSGFPLRKDFPLQGVGYRDDFPDLKEK